MDEFSEWIKEKTGKTFNGNKHHIQCEIFVLISVI